MNITLTKKEADELNLPDSAIADWIIDTTRWSVIHAIIFQKGDKYYQTSCSIAATEMQDESPWEFVDTIECTEVHKVSRTIEVWESV